MSQKNALAKRENEGFQLIEGGKDTKIKKDGIPKLTQSNKIDGRDSKVYPIKNPEQLKQFILYFQNALEDELKNYKNGSKQKWKLYNSARNYFMIIVGLNTAYRISDIVSMCWKDFLNDYGEFTCGQRKKEIKTGKYRNVEFKEEVEQAFIKFKEIVELIEFNTEGNTHIFRTRQSETMTTANAYKIIKDAAKEIGIKQNIGTHSLRKTFVYWSLISHKEDVMYLTTIQEILNHSSPTITLRYAGIEDDERQKVYEDIGEVYRKIINDDYENKHKNVVRVSMDCLWDIIKYVYQTGSADHEAPMDVHVENMETFRELLEEYLV